MEKIFLNSKELAVRWDITTETLKQWRWQKRGPRFFKTSGRITYHVDDVKEFEESKECDYTKKKAKEKSEKDK